MRNLFCLGVTLLLLCVVSVRSDGQLPGSILKCLKRLCIKTPQESSANLAMLRYCTELYLVHHSNDRWNGYNAGSQQKMVMDTITIIGPSFNQNGPQSNVQRRVRKEYRMMSDRERDDFHRAINLLKQDTSITPNVYDAIALLHTGQTAQNAHDGPTFLPWHRIYTMIMEEALREKIPTVTLPFWDPTLDSPLDEPRDSIIWTNKFMGTSNGVVTSGPFANWTTPAGPLVRNVGYMENLPTTENLNNVLSKSRLGEISEPNADETYNFEFHHNSMHDFVGGQVGYLGTAPMDPFFWLIHSYVDLIWMRFHENQRRRGVYPETDYPSEFGEEMYGPDATISIKNITVTEAIRETLTYTGIYSYEYETMQGDCSFKPYLCNSPYLTCNNGTCQTKTRKSSGCSALIPYQNQFCINNVCDMDEWAFLPVEVIYERSFESIKFGNFPFVSGHPNLLSDLYDDNVPAGASAPNNSSNPACRKKKCCGPAGRISLQASGINYLGNYEEMVLVDRRLAVSSEIAYVGIKNPDKGNILVFISAAERCGRICRPACLVAGSNPPMYRNCTGWINMTSSGQKFYGKTLEEAYLKVWDYNQALRPRIKYQNIPIVFYCDDNHWPFHTAESFSTPGTGKPMATTIAPAPTATTRRVPLPTTTIRWTPVPTIRWTPAPTIRWRPAPTNPHPTFVPKKCLVKQFCEIEVGCHCKCLEKHSCRHTCSRYAVCIFGRYVVASCRYGYKFDPQTRQCIPGSCGLYR